MSDVKTSKKTNFSETTQHASRSTKQSKVAPPSSMNSDSRSTKKSNVGPTKSTVSSIIGRRQGPSLPASLATDKPTNRKDIRLFNSVGEDVTPRPLLVPDRKSQPPIVTTDSSGGTPTDLLSQTSVQQQPGVSASTFGVAVFSRSVFSMSESGRSGESISEDLGDPLCPDLGASVAGAIQVEYKHSEQAELTSDDDLCREVDVRLSETETMWLLNMPSVCATSDCDEAPIIIEQNARYEELVKSRPGNDRYAERGMNTFNDLPKHKNVQTDRITHHESSAYASVSDMHDTYSALHVATVTKDDDDEIMVVSEAGKTADDVVDTATDPVPRNSSTLQPNASTERVSMIDSSNRTMTSSFGVSDSVMGTKELRPTVATGNKPIDATILQTDNMKRHLVIVERIVNLNTYQPKQAQYRNFPILTDVDVDCTPTGANDARPATTKLDVITDIGPTLDRLWTYQCSMTRGRNVSCITWNPTNTDLVAVGYGQFEYMKQKSGYVCCWSLKNPEYPERVYRTSAGVLCVDFSKAHPNLLAAGLHDGTIAIFNVAIASSEPVLDSSEAHGKHTCAVWQLRWIEKERGSADEHTEVLVSTSSDGRLTQWAIRKGFEPYDLMKLKRVSERVVSSSTATSMTTTTTTGATGTQQQHQQQQQATNKNKKNDAMIAKFTGGLCFDFSAKDSNIYLAGTEDGPIHRCSCSYNEQYLDTYHGHTGPVYAVQWSPFDCGMFLSCSADWSVRLWHQDRLQPVLNLFSSTKAVLSVCWSPVSSTVFACVNEGALEIWDLKQSTLDPVLVNTPSLSPSNEVKMSAVSFSPTSACLLVGDSDGQVVVFQLHGLHSHHQGDELQQIVNSSLASQLKK